MISYYKSKHPGLFLYLLLISVSVFSFLFLTMTAAHIGILSILWGSFVFMRTLSLYEVSEHFLPFAKTEGASKGTSKRNATLSHDLMHRMNGNSNMKRGLFAMHAMHERTMLWFTLALFYVAYHLYLSMHLISDTLLIQSLSIFFIIGAAFWSGQTYAYSHNASKLLLLVCSALFGLTIFTLNGSATTDLANAFTLTHLLSYGNAASPMLAALIAYSAAILLYSCASGRTYSINALFGLMIVGFLVIYGMTHTPSSQTIALWISGWSLFSIFWIRSYCHTRKSYALYQCE